MLTHHPATTPGNARTDLDRPVRIDGLRPARRRPGRRRRRRRRRHRRRVDGLKLKERGESVALLERDRIVLGVTGHTTAKVTALHGLIYDYLTEHVGEEQASLYAEANEAAIDDVEATVDGARHRLRLRARTGVHVHSRTGGGPGLPPAPARDTGGGQGRQAGGPRRVVRRGDRPALRRRRRGPRRRPGPLPPRNYLLELAQEVPGDGSHVFEETTVEDVSGGSPLFRRDGSGTVTADDVVPRPTSPSATTPSTSRG